MPRRKRVVVADAAPAKPLPDRCPLCGGVMYDYNGSRYCPAEDPHPGGYLIRSDGQVAQWCTIPVPSVSEAG